MNDDYQMAKCTFKPQTNNYKLSLIRRPLTQARPKSAAGTSSKAVGLSQSLVTGGSIMDKLKKQQVSPVLNSDLTGVTSPSPQITQAAVQAP